MPTSTGHRREQCQGCQRWVLRKTLRLMPRDYLLRKGQNYLLYSEYDSAFWTCTASDAGDSAYGTDDARLRLADDNTWSVVNGTKTFVNTGTLRTIAATDVSAFTALCFACWTGVMEDNSIRAYTAVLGICDSAGNNKVQIASRAVSGMASIYGAKAVSTIISPLSAAALYFYLTVTIATGGEWWASDIQLEKDVISPGLHVPTSGAAVVRATDQASRAIIRVCPRCVEKSRDTKNLHRNFSAENREPELPLPITPWED